MRTASRSAALSSCAQSPTESLIICALDSDGRNPRRARTCGTKECMHPRLRGAVVLVVLLTPAVGSAQPAPAFRIRRHTDAKRADATAADSAPTDDECAVARGRDHPQAHVRRLRLPAPGVHRGAGRSERTVRRPRRRLRAPERAARRARPLWQIGSPRSLSFDGAVDERAQVNSPQGTLGFSLRDAYADVTLAGQAVLRAGYFQPLGRSRGTRRRHLARVRRLADREPRRAPTEGCQTPGLPPGRSLGVALRLDPA